jgi:hypothetical protein
MMKSRVAKNFLQVGFLILGVIPTGVLTVWLGGFGLIMGLTTLASGQPAALLIIAWVAAGVMGLAALVATSARIAESNFQLKRWEIIGLIGGFAASVPFPFLFNRNGVHSWGGVLVLGPVALSVVTGLVVIARAWRNGRRPSLPDVV